MAGSPGLPAGHGPGATGGPGRSQLDWWREEVLARFLPLDVSAVDASRFRAVIRDVKVGDMAVFGIEADAQRVRRGRRQLAQGGAGDWYLLVQETGPAVIHAGDRSVGMTPGDVVVLDTAQPYTLDFPARFRQSCVVVPRRCLDASTGRSHGAVLPPDAAATRAMRDLCRLVSRHGSGLPLTTSRDLLETIANLTHAALAPTAVPSPRQTRLEQLLDVIDRGSTDHDFSPASAARELSVSVRHVHGLLEQTGRSFGEHVKDRRVARAVRLLTAPALDAVTIAEIAHRAGFGEVSTFNRAVRERYDTTPSTIRRRARGATSPARHA